MKAVRLVLLLTAFLTVGCAEPPLEPEVRLDAQSSDLEPPVDPLGLVGTWEVTGTGEATGAVVRISVDRVSVEQGCRRLDGTWRGDWDGLFLASFGAGSLCPDDVDAERIVRGPDWITTAARFGVDGRDRLLLGSTGEPLARLSPHDAPPPPYEQAPQSSLTDDARRAWQPAVPLPAGVAAGDLVGRWVPADGSATDAFVELAATGDWTGSDGCNGDGGRWTTGPNGAFLATHAVATTLIGCENVAVGSWLGQARRAGFDGSTLVLSDAQGAETGRLRRSGS